MLEAERELARGHWPYLATAWTSTYWVDAVTQVPNISRVFCETQSPIIPLTMQFRHLTTYRSLKSPVSLLCFGHDFVVPFHNQMARYLFQ